MQWSSLALKGHPFKVEQLVSQMPGSALTWIRIVVTALCLPQGANMILNIQRFQRIQSCFNFTDKEAKTQVYLDPAVL